MKTLIDFLFWWVNAFRTPKRYGKQKDPERINNITKWVIFDYFEEEEIKVGSYQWHERYEASKIVRTLNKNYLKKKSYSSELE